MPQIRMPDNTLVNFPDEMPPEQIKGLIASKFPQEVEKISKFEGFTRGLKNMASFGLDDELRGFGRAVGSKIRGDERSFGDLVGRGIDEIRGEYERSQEQQPGATLTGEIAGAVVPAFLPGGQALSARVSSGGRMARVAKSGLAAGGASAAYGFGSAEGNPLERLPNAAAYGAGGFTLGAAIPAVGIGAGKLSDLYKSSRKPVEDKATQIVLRKLLKDNTDPQALDRVFRNGVGLIEEAGPSTRRLAEGVAQFPDKAAKVSEDYFESRLAGSTKRAKTAIKNNISKVDDFYGTIDDIFEKGQAKAAPLYEKAFKTSVSSKNLDKILNTPAGKSALKQAVTKMQNDMTLAGVPDKELSKLARELEIVGSGAKVSSGLKLRTLDYVKRSLDDMIEGSQRAGEKDNARILVSLKKNLLTELDRASPAYSKARKTAGDYLSNANALEKGREFLKSDADTLLREFKDLGETEKKMFRAGVSRAVRDQIDNTFDEGNYVRRILGKEETRNKLKSVLGDGEYKELVKSLNAEDKLFKLRNQILKGSQTSRRLAEMQDLMNDPSEAIDQIARKGIKGFGVDKFLKFISNKYTGLNTKVAGEVAEILYETNPQKQYQILNRLQSAAKSGDKQAIQGLNTYSAISGAVGRKSASLIGEE